jgi:hypothetical protein
MRYIWVFLLGICALCGQQPQNPSPMVEHTRPHQRLEQSSPVGRGEALELGKLFIPATLQHRSRAPLLIFFHGGDWLPQVAAAHNQMALVDIQIGAGSGVYARAFEDPARFARLLREAEQKAGMKFDAITLGGWSAGCGAIREILKSRDSYALVSQVLAIDGIHTDYANGKPGPLESQLATENLAVWVRLAHDAVAGRKRIIVTHTEIFPGTFASTTETADYLLGQLGLARRAILRWGPMKTQELSEVRAGRFLLIGFAGNSAPDHVDQLHSLPEYLRWLRSLG